MPEIFEAVDGGGERIGALSCSCDLRNKNLIPKMNFNYLTDLNVTITNLARRVPDTRYY